MYNALGATKGLSLTKIIGGIAKTLQIANQVIPLYQKTKPMIQNAKSLFSVVKEMKKATPTSTTPQKNISTTKNTENKTNFNLKKESNASPTFFL